MKKIFILLFMFINTILYATSVKYIPILMKDITIFVPDNTLSFGLIGHYKFEGNTNDSSANRNDGIQYGGIKYSTGIIGKAASFDGINDYIKIIPKSNVSHIQDFTIAVWTYFNTKKNTDTEGRRYYIFDGHSWSSNTSTNYIFKDGFSLIYDATTHVSEIHNAISRGYGRYSISTELNTPRNIKNRWTHMAFVRKGSYNYTYINGNRIQNIYNQQGIFDEILNMQHSWFVGTFSGNNKNYRPDYNYSYKGKLDELRIYNRALDISEIKKLYNMRKN